MNPEAQRYAQLCNLCFSLAMRCSDMARARALMEKHRRYAHKFRMAAGL